MISRRTLLMQAGSAAALGTLSAAVCAQSSKPLTVVVGFPAGVVTDNVARAIAEELRPSYSAGIIVENRVGAGGRIAADYVRRASPDGYTILLTPGFVMTVFPHVYRQLGFDPWSDFKPVAGVASFDYAITVGPAVPASVKTLADLAEWCRADAPTRALYGIPAAGSTPHFIGTLLAKDTGVPFKPVPYKGGAQLIQDLLGGQIPAAIDPLANAIQYHQAGRLRVLAIAGKERSPLLPEVPTVTEMEMDSMAARELFGVFVPSKVPDARVQALEKQLLDASAKARNRFTAMQVNAESLGQAELLTTLHRESDRWKEVVQASGFKAD